MTEVFVVDAGVAGSVGFVDVSVGWYHSCGLRPSGDVECWNDGTEIRDVGQFAVPQGVSFRQIAAGAEHICGLDEEGFGGLVP